MTFDELWSREERQGLQQRLQSEYPAWQRRRRQRVSMVCSVAALMVVGISVYNFHFSVPKGYDYVACNRSGIPSGHWADVAGNILISDFGL